MTRKLVPTKRNPKPPNRAREERPSPTVQNGASFNSDGESDEEETRVGNH